MALSDAPVQRATDAVFTVAGELAVYDRPAGFRSAAALALLRSPRAPEALRPHALAGGL